MHGFAMLVIIYFIH